MPLLNDPTPAEIAEEETNRAESLRRSRIILGIYYTTLPFILVYLLFKIFPPHPWPITDKMVQMVFFVNKLNIWTTVEERLLLLVIVAGALGSYIHSSTSYADYRGNRQFAPSWTLWYFLRPFVGICLALIVYFAVRGGLLSVVLSGDEANDATKINPFGIAAIAGLTGMFSKQAADKLAEVFTTLFKSQGDQQRRDSLTPAPAPEIKSIDPKEGPAAGGNKVTITGTGFATGAKVSFGTNAATNITVVIDTVLTVDAPAGEGIVDVTVTNADGQKATAAQAYTYLGGDNGGGGAAVEGGAGAGAAVDELDGHEAELEADTADEQLPITEGGVE
jgi:hypothetical protein